MLIRTAWSVARSSVLGLRRNIAVSTVQLQPRQVRSPIASNDGRTQTNEFDTIAEIESNLFEASSHKSVSVQPRTLKTTKQPPSPPKNIQPKANRVREPSPVLVDPDLNLSYTKLSLSDPLLTKLMVTAKSRKARDKKGQIVVEGRRLILDAIAAGVKLETILFAQKANLMEMKDQVRQCKSSQIYRVPAQDLRSWSTLVTCPGVIAIFRRPSEMDIEIAAKTRDTLPITVICDNIREPNNLGSIIRSCAAIPCQEVFVTKGCCDPWDTKSLRGGSGAQFHVSIYDDLTWEQIDNRLLGSPSGSPHPLPVVYLAESNAANCNKFGVEVVPYDKMQIFGERSKCVLIIGGETHGISEDAYSLLRRCNEKDAKKKTGGCLHIPMAKNINSLNTAAAVTLLLFELRKKIVDNSKASLK